MVETLKESLIKRPHNWELEQDNLDEMLNHLRGRPDSRYFSMEDDEIMEKALYHYGGTICSAILNALMNEFCYK